MPKPSRRGILSTLLGCTKHGLLHGNHKSSCDARIQTDKDRIPNDLSSDVQEDKSQLANRNRGHEKADKNLRLAELLDVSYNNKREVEGEEDKVNRIQLELEEMNHIKTLEEENEKLLRHLEEKSLEIFNLKEEIEKCNEAVNTQKLKYDDALRNLSSATKAKTLLSARLAEQDKRIVKLEHSLALPLTSRIQREELQVVREALMSLRRCFACNDPYQHTLDTVEQSISALLERVNALEMGKVPDDAVQDIDYNGDQLDFSFDNSKQSHQISNYSSSGFSNHRLDDIRRIDYQSTTKVIYYTDKSLTPFLCAIPKKIGEITLKDFKDVFDRPGNYRYHFKTLDPEFGMVKEEILHDDDILPGWDDKVIVWVEDDNS